MAVEEDGEEEDGEDEEEDDQSLGAASETNNGS